MSNEVSVNTKLSDIPDYQSVYVPRSTYRHKVVDVKFEKSKSSGNPMFTLSVEICDHAGFVNPKNGEKVDLNGTAATVYLSLTDKAASNLKRFFKACGLPTDITIAELLANPNPEIFRGRQFLAMGQSKMDIQVDEITNQPIKHPVTGQDIVYYRYDVKEVFATP